jgi:hypothetical protein
VQGLSKRLTMPTNPYRHVHRLQRRHRWRQHPWEAAWPWLAPVLLGGLASPLARPILLWFEGRSPEIQAVGLAGASLRLGLALCGAGILVVHEQVVRGQERRILDPHPVEPGALVRAMGLRLLRSTSGLALGACLLLSPLATDGRWAAFAMACTVVLGGWLAGTSVGFLAQLGAVWAARNPSLAGLLDLVRGSSPPMQAALIWAPGLAIGACGAALVGATAGVEAALLGDPVSAAALSLPFLLAIGGWLLVPALARRTWYQATTVLAEVDAAWAAVEDPEAARRVYLEWALRWTPPDLRPHLLRSLRQGWRARRSWVTGAWGLGFLAAVAGWTAAPEASTRALLVASSSVALLAALAIRMETGDPPWLGRALGLRGAPVVTARFLVVLAYLQGAVLPAVAAVWLRRGSEAFALLGWLEALSVLAAGLASSLSLLGKRAWFAYPPTALALWILVNRSLP